VSDPSKKWLTGTKSSKEFYRLGAGKSCPHETCGRQRASIRECRMRVFMVLAFDEFKIVRYLYIQQIKTCFVLDLSADIHSNPLSEAIPQAKF